MDKLIKNIKEYLEETLNVDVSEKVVLNVIGDVGCYMSEPDVYGEDMDEESEEESDVECIDPPAVDLAVLIATLFKEDNAIEIEASPIDRHLKPAVLAEIKRIEAEIKRTGIEDTIPSVDEEWDDV